MNLYLTRHGDAVPALENPARPLSAIGRAQVERMARLAQERNLRASVIYHSGILRAKQTAEILARHYPAVIGVTERAGLLPEDDPESAKAEIDLADDPLVLVGHLPFMSRLAGLLINNDPERPVVEFSPGAMLCCTRSAGQWKFTWYLAP